MIATYLTFLAPDELDALLRFLDPRPGWPAWACACRASPSGGPSSAIALPARQQLEFPFDGVEVHSASSRWPYQSNCRSTRRRHLTERHMHPRQLPDQLGMVRDTGRSVGAAALLVVGVVEAGRHRGAQEREIDARLEPRALPDPRRHDDLRLLAGQNVGADARSHGRRRPGKSWSIRTGPPR